MKFIFILGLVIIFTRCASNYIPLVNNREVWVVDSLKEPDCLICKEVKLPVNKVYGKEISTKYHLILDKKHQNLLFINASDDTLINVFFIMKKGLIRMYKSDTYNSMKIVQKTRKNMILTNKQNVLSNIGEKPKNDLIIYLSKVK